MAANAMTSSTENMNTAKPPGHGSFRSTRGEGYGDLYMMDDQLASDPRKRRLSERQQEFLQAKIDALPPGAVVADIPCGNGRMTQLTASRPDLFVVPMDYNEVMLANIPQRSPEANYLGHRMRTDIMAMPLADNSVDLLINFRLLHHIPEHTTRVRMLAEMARVCRGTIVSTYWTTRCWRYVRKRVLGKKIRGNPISPDELRTCCEEAGLQIELIKRTDVWTEEECIIVCRPV